MASNDQFILVRSTNSTMITLLRDNTQKKHRDNTPIEADLKGPDVIVSADHMISKEPHNFTI